MSRATARHAGVLLGPVLLAALAAAAPAHADGPQARTNAPVVTEADAAQAAAVVAAEDRRLTQIRTVSSLARWQGESWKTPYRTSTGSGFTLVLTPRAEPYGVQDLLALAPQTFLRLSDGSFLLSEHLIVLPGATLHLARPGGLSIRLSSSSRGFSTIVSLGGRIEVAGVQGAPVRLSSWDVDSGAVDLRVQDGRAYVRALGGQFDADYLEAADLGFWSGRTGGIALTGTDRPNTGALERIDEGDESAPSVLEGVTTQPAGPLQSGQVNPNLAYTVPAVDYVSSRLSHTTVVRSAFGLFVSGANGLQVSDSSFRDSSIAGVVLHRFVSNGVISDTESVGNAGDGFSLERATTGITLSEVTARDNAGSGISLSGKPLSLGPSATGAPTSSYGGNSVANSTAEGNGHYGIEVLGGFNIGVQNNQVADNDMGIVVTGPATRIAVTGNRITRSDRHGIALVNGVTDSTVMGNVVDSSSTGVYLRDSTGEVTGNTIRAATSHALSLVGGVGGTAVEHNVLAGDGASAFDSGRSTGAFTTVGNNLDGWRDTSPWHLLLKKLLQPMTALWASIVLLMAVSALRSRTRPDRVAHPYEHQMAHGRPAPAPPVLQLRTHLAASTR